MSMSSPMDMYGPGGIKASYRTGTSQDRCCYSPRGGTNIKVTTKLEHAPGKFTSLYSDLESDKQQKRTVELEKYSTLKHQIDEMENTMQLNVTRAHESNVALQHHVDSEIQKLSDRMSISMKELQVAMKSSLDQLGRSIHDLAAAFPEEREQRKADVEHVGSTLCSRLDDTVAALDEERFARLEQERESLRRVGEDLYKLNERVDSERTARETAVNEVASEMHNVMLTRNEKEQRFTAKLADELACLQTQVSAETVERVREDEAIVSAINDYTRALQEGLRIVGGK